MGKRICYILVIIITITTIIVLAINKRSQRETIFTSKVTIPTNLTLKIPQLPPLCEQILNLKKGYINIPDGKLYYEEEGNGEPLALINGGPGCSHHVFHPYFSQIKTKARIIYYDQRGTGKSSFDNTGKTYTLNQAIEDLETLRKALKIERWTVLGWSYGGLLAQIYALTYPQHTTGLILVTAMPGFKNVAMQSSREQKFISVKENSEITKIREQWQQGNITEKQALYNLIRCGDWKRQHYTRPTTEEIIRTVLYEWSPAPNFNELMSIEIDKVDLAGKFVNFTIPTLIMEAKWDLTWPADKALLLKQNHPQAKLVMFAKSGHKIFADEEKKFFVVLTNFLAKIKQCN